MAWVEQLYLGQALLNALLPQRGHLRKDNPEKCAEMTLDVIQTLTGDRQYRFTFLVAPQCL